VLRVLVADIALFSHNQRESDRDQGDRDGCRDPPANQRYSPAQHEDDGNCQQSQIPQRRSHFGFTSFRGAIVPAITLFRISESPYWHFADPS
jgi:hypothetical protein